MPYSSTLNNGFIVWQKKIVLSKNQKTLKMIQKINRKDAVNSILMAISQIYLRYTHGINMNVNESAENYLETILILSKTLPVVRSVDIATELGFKKSSVSVAMKHLRENNYITVTDAGFIYLTDAGKEIANMIYERHNLLSSLLTKIGVEPKIAVEDACKIEHVISKESFEAIKKYFSSHQ